MDFVFDYKSTHLLIRDLVCLFFLISFLIKRQVVSSNSKRSFIEYVYYLVFIFFTLDAVVIWTNHLGLLSSNGLYLYACLYYLFILGSAAISVYNSGDMLGLHDRAKRVWGVGILASIIAFALAFVFNFKSAFFFRVEDGSIIRGYGANIVFIVTMLYYVLSFAICVYKGYKEK